MTTTMKSKRGKLLAQLNGDANVTILGYVCWWDVRGVEIDRERFIEILTDCGFTEKYAREHNYRSAFLRALKNMETQRIIRMVKEDRNYLIYQFTAEDRVDESFEYNPETIITIDKEVYRQTKSIDAAITKGDPAIKEKIIKHFMREKVTYKSSDVSRTLHKIFVDNADIVALREQGSVYYVPGGYKNVLESASKYVGMLGGICRFSYIPIPDAPESRATVKAAVEDEVETFIAWLEGQIEELESGKEVTERWYNTKDKKLAEARDRLELYAELLGDGKTGIEAKFAVLEKKLFPGRTLDI